MRAVPGGLRSDTVQPLTVGADITRANCVAPPVNPGTGSTPAEATSGSQPPPSGRLPAEQATEAVTTVPFGLGPATLA